MNNRRTKSIFKILLSQIGVSFIVVLMAFSILFYAEGYRFNYKSLRFSKTGIISLATSPKDAAVTIDGVKKMSVTPFSQNLLAGYYFAEIEKEGYLPWSATIKIESGLVSGFKEIVLIKENISVGELSDQKFINQLNFPLASLAAKQNNGLYYNDYEIWLNDKLITRFSSPISNVIWYPDESHFVYQEGNQIRIIETDGLNDTLLVRLDQNTPTSYVLDDKGENLYFIDNGKYEVANFR